MSSEIKRTNMKPSEVQISPKDESLNPTLKDGGIHGLRDRSTSEDPFVIRGHHLSQLGMVITGWWTPDNGARAIKEDSVKDLDTDYTGTNPEDAGAFEKGVFEGLDKFMKLPDEAPVRIVANQPDWICESCVIGEHCGAKLDDPLANNRDSSYIEAFRRSARERGIDGGITLEDDVVVYSNAPAETKKSLVTDAGTVRQVWNVDTENMERTFPTWVRYVEGELKDQIK